MLRPILALLVCAALLVTVGCSDSSEPEPAHPAVSGQVLDAAGDPVADAAIVLDLEFSASSPAAAEKPRTAIGFALAESGRFTLSITDACDDEILYALSDSLAAGNHTVFWDGQDNAGLLLVEGFYHAHFEAEGRDPVVHDLALARNWDDETGEFATVAGTTVRESWRVEAWTDQDGRFRIARDCWEFGESTVTTDETGTVIGRFAVAPRVRVWAYPADHAFGAGSGWADFDALTGAAVTIQLGN